MAFLIFNSNNVLLKIAADSASKDAQNLDFNTVKVKDIPEADFIKLKSNTHYATLSGDTVNITSLDIQSESLVEENLKKYHADIIKYIEYFEKNNSNNLMFTECVNYKNYLLNLDYATLTFPLNNNWEKYCQDNSIAYLNTLQIP